MPPTYNFTTTSCISPASFPLRAIQAGTHGLSGACQERSLQASTAGRPDWPAVDARLEPNCNRFRIAVLRIQCISQAGSLLRAGFERGPLFIPPKNRPLNRVPVYCYCTLMGILIAAGAAV